MPGPATVVGCRRVRSSWSVIDFVLVWLGGILGAGIFAAFAGLLSQTDWLIVLGLAGQYLGNIAVFLYLARRKADSEIGFAIENSDFAYVGVGIFLQLVVALASRPLVELLFPGGESPQQITEVMAGLDASTLLKITFFTAAVVMAPVTEELMFRGVLLRALASKGRAFVITMTATVFAVVHVIGLNFERPLASAAVVLPPVFLLGILLAWVTLRTGRLGPAIFAHSGWNLLAAIVLLIPTELLESVS